MNDTDTAPEGATPDLSPVAYRAIIEGLLRYAGLGEVGFSHQSLLRRAYAAAHIEVVEVTRYHEGKSFFEHLTVVPRAGS